MNKLKKVSFLIIFFLAVAMNAFSQEKYSVELAKIFDFYESQNLFNGSVLVSKKGQILLSKGYGFKNAEANLKNNPNGVFQIYSVTKTFTSTVVLKLVEEGKISLTDKLSKYYPGYPKGDSITIENLLTHTSGIYDYTHGNDMEDQSEESFINFQKTKPLDFPAGTDWSYSNSGYYFLGYIIQKVTGMTYEQAVEIYIFKPLGMTNSGFAFKNLQNENKAIGYKLYSEKRKIPSIVYDPPGPFAAGGIYSTVEDLYKYYQGISTFKILSKKSLDKAFSVYKNNYGYGWIINQMFDKKTVGHSGSGAGFKSNFLQIPEDDTCIILLSNTERDLSEITNGVLKILYNQYYKIPNPVEASSEELVKYIGTYEVNSNFIIYVTLEDGKLIGQVSNQPKVIMYPEDENKFYLQEMDGYIHFKMNNLSKIDTLIINKGERIIKATKIHPSWGIVGNGNKEEWEGLDIKLTETVTKGIWDVKNVKIETGELKFRFNNDWTVSLGKNVGNELIPDGENIKIDAGIYDISLDLSNTNHLTYKIEKR